MKPRDKARLLDGRMQLLEVEAGLQRAALSATFAKWQERRLLAVGSTVATWGWRLLSVPKIRWMVAAAVLAKFRKRRKH
jgi:hypothetical protein